MRYHITFIGAASSWGGAQRGPEQAPLAFWVSGIADAMQRPHLTVDWHGIVETADPAPAHDLKLNEAYPHVKHIASGLAREIEEIMHAQPFTIPIVIGGDHAVAMGTWSGVTTALNAQGNFGLLWIDAHMDAHTPETASQGKWGGHWHGMPLAHLLGHGDKDFCNIASIVPKLDPRHVALVGVRSYEPGEAELLKRLGVAVFTMDDIAAQGLNTVMQKALAIVGSAPNGWGISLDIDAFDPADIECVSTPEPNGIRLQEFLQTFSAQKLPSFPRAVEIVEYVPEKDPDKRGLQAIENFLWLLFKK